MSKFAALVRGTTYVLGNKKFNKGDKPIAITDAEYDLLTDDTPGEAHGFDRIEVEGREELRPKFAFTDGEAEGEAVAKPVRTRVRKPDNSGAAE